MVAHGITRWIVGSLALGLAPITAAAQPVDYLRDIKPILRERCHACHGAIEQESDLRLDTGRLARQGGASGSAIEPGNPDASLLVARVSADDPFERMPPEGDPLTPDEIDRLRRWIAQGAPSPDDEQPELDPRQHWAFHAPTRPPIPTTEATWSTDPIDRFVLARLERDSISPSPRADRVTLLRRLSLDLLGLPPTLDQLAAVEADSRPDWYERLVDRLLASPHFGERWGKHWLDLARFADSDGNSGERVRPNAWRYRDWVVDAINRDLPFDQFTIQQLAGDLLPDAGLAERTAAGFHRHALTSRETCVDEEDKRVRVVIDRTIVTGEVWLGLTVACCQCHTHKYDPLTQREFFGLYAFFDNLEDADVPLDLPGEEAAAIATLRESSSRRMSFVHLRGDFHRPGEPVQPHTFGVLPDLRPRGELPDRLDLARWIVDQRNPLTARVVVNHVWKHLFGEGLVATVNDFGTRGEPPSHPELLDWLASELVARGWSRKELIRRILLSETYRQSSAHRDDLLTRDPGNRLLARQNRFRLEGEILRDASLAAAGGLAASIGGPSFRPPVPPDAGHGVLAEWKPQDAIEAGRRGMYVVMQRTVPHPVLATLDVPDGNTPCLQRTRANTPVQALTLLNDPMFFQSARALGRRVGTIPGTFVDQATVLYRLAVGRSPSEFERQQVELLYRTAVEEFARRPDAARQWLGLTAPSDEAGDAGEPSGAGSAVLLSLETTEVQRTAAWIVVAQTVLNLDEFMTRE